MMKKGVFKSSVLLVTAVFAILAAGNALSVGFNAPEPGAGAVNSAGGNGYVVKSYNGVIALYTEQSPVTPAAVTEIPVESLRAYDRQLLENGINVTTYDDVIHLLEDFSN